MLQNPHTYKMCLAHNILRLRGGKIWLAIHSAQRRNLTDPNAPPQKSGVPHFAYGRSPSVLIVCYAVRGCSRLTGDFLMTINY